jgi:hypothetical protein
MSAIVDAAESVTIFDRLITGPGRVADPVNFSDATFETVEAVKVCVREKVVLYLLYNVTQVFDVSELGAIVQETSQGVMT